VRRILATTAVVLAVSACSSASKHPAADIATPGPLPTVTATASSVPRPGETYLAPPGALPAPGTTVPMSTAEAPWPAPVLVAQGKNSAAYVAAAGLSYAEEMLKVHYHAHLDVLVAGAKVPVPAYLGFVVKGDKVAGLAALHTHDASGVIHIENAVAAQFVLGQVFTEWGVRFTPDCLGAYCAGAGKELAVFVDGKRYDGDPRWIVLTRHQEIAVEFGDAGRLPAPPASYAFSHGQ
jgi:hypothetical protein